MVGGSLGRRSSDQAAIKNNYAVRGSLDEWKAIEMSLVVDGDHISAARAVKKVNDAQKSESRADLMEKPVHQTTNKSKKMKQTTKKVP